MTHSTSPASSFVRKSVILLVVINLLCYLDRYLIAAVVPEIIQEFLPDSKNPRAIAGLLSTAFLVAYMVTAPIFGYFADRFSRWKLIALSVAVWSLACGASGLAGSFFVLLMTRIFLGVGEAGYGPAAPTILSDLYPVERRGFILSCFYIAIPVGSAFGYLLGGIVSHHWSWHWAFFIMTPPGLLLALLCLMMKDPRKAPVQKEARKTSFIEDYRQLVRIPSLLINIAAQTALTFSVGGIAFWMPTYLHEAHGFDLDKGNFYFGAITVVGGLTSTLIGGLLADRLRNRFAGSYFLVSGWGMILGFVSIIAILYCPFPAAWIFVFLAIFFLFLNTGPSNTALANVTPPSIRATAFAVNIFIIHALGDAISPSIIGGICDKTNWNTALLFVSGVTLVAGVLWLMSMKALVTDTQKVQELEEQLSATADSQTTR